MSSISTEYYLLYRKKKKNIKSLDACFSNALKTVYFSVLGASNKEGCYIMKPYESADDGPHKSGGVNELAD